jgi:AraC-like DNA-binding protein
VDAGAPRLETEGMLGSLLTHLLLRHAVRGRTAEPVPAAAGPALDRVREILSGRLTENVALVELAIETGVNRFSLLRAFSRAYGLTPHAWVIQERVRRSRDLLRAGRAPAEVAAAVGFADQSHLTRHFKRLVGVTPGRYRTVRTRGR